MTASQATPSRGPIGRRRRRSIVTTLGWCFVAVALLTVAATVLTLRLFGDVRASMSEITDVRLEEISRAFQFVQAADHLEDAVVDLNGVQTESELARAREGIEGTLVELDVLSADLTERHGFRSESIEAIERASHRIDSALDGLFDTVARRLDAEQRLRRLLDAMNASQDGFVAQIVPIVEAERDAILASTRMNVREGTVRIGSLIDDGFEALRSVLSIEASAAAMAATLYRASIDVDPDMLMARRLDLVQPVATIETALGQLSEFDGSRPLSETIERMYAVGFEPGNMFETRLRWLADQRPENAEALDELIAETEEALEDLGRRTEAILEQVDQQIIASNAEAAREGRGIILVSGNSLSEIALISFVSSDVALFYGLMGLAGLAAAPDEIERIVDRSEATRRRIASRLGDMATGERIRRVEGLVFEALDYASGARSVPEARLMELDRVAEAGRQGAMAREFASDLVAAAGALAAEAEALSAQALARTRADIDRGERILIAIAVLSFVLVFVLAWVFVYRAIVTRLRGLSQSMLRIADGDLEAALPPPGPRDEIGDMAATLAVFQTNAIQRRNAEAALLEAKNDAEAALAELQSAQSRLVHAEKMASLGQLTAGIAHEIKNPLNFVNNFSKLSIEMIDELREITADTVASLPEDDREEAKDLMRTVEDNLGKIAHHGQRADSIVRNMLMHSRGGSGDLEKGSANALVEEAVTLAYHGARAETGQVSIDMAREFDEAAGDVTWHRQEIMRVLLNLVANAIYAATHGANRESARIVVSTHREPDAVRIVVRDNGDGVPADKLQRIFDPFFTTKPPDEGTGLGLSLSHNIVVDQHGGELTVQSVPGDTRFTVVLPRDQSAQAV